MTASFQSQIQGLVDLKQILVTVGGGETGVDLPIPIMEDDTWEGQPIGLLLALTHSSGSKQNAYPRPTTDQVQVMRMIPVGTASADIILKSVNPSTGVTSHASPAIQLTNPSDLPVDPSIPIFICDRGDYLTVQSDVATSFIMQVAVKGRFA